MARLPALRFAGLEQVSAEWTLICMTHNLSKQYQQDLVQARSFEATARANYWKAQAELDRALGTLLSVRGMVFEQAVAGTIVKQHSAPLVFLQTS
jgi:hypothetical protein